MTAEPSPPDETPQYGLVMRFLPVTSRGGPFDDQAYVAGWEMGQLDALLGSSFPDTVTATVNADNREQADLVGMKHGYRCQVRDAGDSWVFVQFTEETE